MDGDTPEERQDAVAELRDLLEGRPEVLPICPLFSSNIIISWDVKL